MSKPRAIGLVLMVAGVCAYGTAPDWLALLVGLLGLATTLFADARYLKNAIARRHFSSLIDCAILLTALASWLRSGCGGWSARGQYETGHCDCVKLLGEIRQASPRVEAAAGQSLRLIP
jgi:hypothetical protein